MGEDGGKGAWSQALSSRGLVAVSGAVEDACDMVGKVLWSCMSPAPSVLGEAFSCTWIPPVKCRSTLWNDSNYYSTKTKHQKLIALERSLTIFV